MPDTMIPIPSPPAIPFIGHLNVLDRDLPIKSLNLLAQQYGEIFQLNILGNKRIFVSSYELQNELSDDKRFPKAINANLQQVRNAVGDGLFTAFPHEQNWAVAHRLLMPCFGTASVYGMFDGMMDIISQLVLKWERFGPHESIDPAGDYTRLTLDAISLCAMSYRLNSFYRPEPHPFATAMADFLIECGHRSNRPNVVQAMMPSATAKYEADMKTMVALADEIVADHKVHPPEKPDLVQVMLTGRDKETGLGLTDESVKNNLLTFLIAGHETTSGMLTFITYYLLKNPETMRKLREEVDEKIGERAVTVRDVNQLPYLLAVMREGLRLGTTAPARTVSPAEDTIIGGKYEVKKGDNIIIVTYNVHRDPKVWGEDVNEFRPERMLDGKFEALPPSAWQPFGFGLRGCIGRPFAWQEVQLTLITILQRFDLIMRDPTYELELKQTLTIKPHNFYIHALPRKDRSAMMFVSPSSKTVSSPSGATTTSATDGLRPLHILYGSNTGNSESFAQRLASAAPAHGFRASLDVLDMATEHFPKDAPVLIVTASFEGQPADNAKHFVEWLENVKLADVFSGATYAVFGCGNRDWVATYQRIPTLIDRLLEEHGAIRLVARGDGDAGSAEFFDAFDQWEKAVWEKLSTEYGSAAAQQATGLEIKTVTKGTTRAEILCQRDLTFGTVVETKTLSAPGAPTKKHIEFALPEGQTYRAGDYLAVLPVNPERVVRRAISRLGLSDEQEIEISSDAPTSLPTGKPVTIFNILSGYVELQQPATMRDLDILLKARNSAASTAVLEGLKANYTEKVFTARLSVLDILEDNKDIDISFGQFLQLLPSMRIRQYSISSSPLWKADHATLTLSVVDAPSRSGRVEPFLGVASTYLAGLRPGDKVQMAVRLSNAAFHPPQDLTVPLVMFCAGSGLAPMRGFLQERAEQKKAGREVGKSLLFYGCRKPGEDFLYGDSDLKKWAELGVVDVRSAFSRSSESSEGCCYVQDRIMHDKLDVMAAYNNGAKFFVCGSSKVAAGVKQTILEFIKENNKSDDSAALATFDMIMKGRYATDVFE